MSTTALNGINPNQIHQFNAKNVLGSIIFPKKEDSVYNINFEELKSPIGACDSPEDGGIGGNLGREDKPIIGACEERPTMIDPETGEIVYVDVYRQEQFPTRLSYKA